MDKSLMLFMLLLLAQTAFTLFLSQTPSPATNAIDIVVRTSAAAIYGYFLSGSFGKQAPDGQTPLPAGVLQTAVVAAVGMLSLLLLIAVRNLSLAGEANTAAASQLRDFISAGVGFLVSLGKGNGRR